MALRRGFKSEANATARGIRTEMGLSPMAPLDPRALAEHLAIPVLTLSSMGEDAPYAVHHFSSVSPAEFSAMTVFCGTRRVIVYNDSHSNGRQASDIAHELSHGILLHPPRPALDAKGCRHWNDDVEDEAEWLSGALLISEEAALSIARRRLPLDQAATFYGVSQQMVRWRLGTTGAQKRLARTRQFYSRRQGN
jgi:Zn-dependent peptidase ImmA (M78 family)